MSYRSPEFQFGKNFPTEDSVSIHRPPPGNFPQLDRDFPEFKSTELKELPNNRPAENIRLYITLKKTMESNIEYKKMILMTSTGIKISMLKRQIEKEFSDLFPKEPTFICGKLEDEFGYSLSNSSYVYELLKNGDRIFAIPEGFSPENADSLEMHLTNDIQELLFLLKSIQQNVCSKLADCSYKNYENSTEVLVSLIPLGFSQSRVIVHNIAVILNKIFASERLNVFEDRSNALIFNLMITLINYWIADLVSNDNFLLSATVDLLEVLSKSALFCEQFKSAFIINNLMNTSKHDFISAQTRSRIIKIITYFSKGEFKNFYEPRPITRSLQGTSSKAIKREATPNNQSPFFENANPGTSLYQPTVNSTLSRTARNREREYKASGDDELDYERVPRQPKKENDLQNYRNLNNDDILGRQAKRENDLQNYRNFNNDDILGRQNPQKKKNAGNSISNQANSNLINDFVNLLSPENSKEMLIFAIQNLDPIIENIIDSIIENKEAYLKCMNLIEINLPPEHTPSQIKILETINKYLTEARALDGLQNKIVPRFLKGFSLQSSKFQPVFYNMLQTHLTMGKFRVDVTTLISMISCPFVRLQELGIKILAELSDPNVNEFNNYDLQFENHVKFLLETSLSKKKSYEFKNAALTAISNLSLKDSLRPQIVYNSGIETLLFHLRNEENLEGQRIAAKGLLNLSIKSRDLKLRIVTELGEEIKKMNRGEIDSIVNGYLQTLMQAKENKY